jgi:hypothetical protein
MAFFIYLVLGGLSCLLTPFFNEEYSEIKALSVILFWPFWMMPRIWKLILEIFN